MKKWKKIILAVSAIVALVAVFAAVYLFISQGIVTEKFECCKPDNSGAVTEDMKEAIRDDAPYGTYRVLLRGIPGSYYLVDGYSIDYGTRVYVNGSKTLEIGTVGTSAEDSVGCVNYMTFPLSI